MNQEITVPEPNHALGPVLKQAEEYVRQSKAKNTRDAYARDWEHFHAWCLERGLNPLPAIPETISLYVAELAEKMKPSSIQRHLASISVAHQAKGFASPTHSLLVRATVTGVRRVKGGAVEKKSPVRVGHLIHLSDVLPKNLQGVRDRAIFLVGYAGAFRRSELVALDVEDLRFEPEGARITVRRSKTDQEALGHTKDINHAAHSANCPVRALKQWLEAAHIESGPLFRPVNRHGTVLDSRLTPQSIALVVKRVMKALKMDPAQFSGHSLRAGFVTDAVKHGIQSQAIRRVTGHRSEATLSGYYREADMFDYNILAKLGL